ncbi:MAG TPA: 1-deoxy-D-xylulose-5-phosphate reductoisomerase [Methylomirabilota bacterium]|jgi:1-deoxy-D-xylulose-5-phosphate reductoisomerase|nr:1-deoxy-D-xylulose-5-phosphate reductoisomerase [Methylomirabilota bacterium]
MKQLTVLGATGSVGRRALDLVAHFPEQFRVEGLAARGSNPGLVAELCRAHRPRVVALSDEDAVDALARALGHPRPEILGGARGLVTLARDLGSDVVLSAIVGGAGLLPTMAAIESGKAVAIANKEPLVMAGSLMTAAARRHKAPLLPVDSEHSAIYQCLEGQQRGQVHRILLTASGGPFRRLPKAEMAAVTVEDALNHPTWKMGAKITVDSATLMNKGLEVIEARWLFDLPSDQVQVVVHPQSIIHSMVEYVDGSVIAQLGVADMGIPILYALNYPDRLPWPGERLDLTKTGALTFEEPDVDRFPCLALARQALTAAGCAPAILNAANEVAVGAFLEGRIGYTQIADLIAAALDGVPARALDSIETCVVVDGEARRFVEERVPGKVPAAAGRTGR